MRDGQLPGIKNRLGRRRFANAAIFVLGAVLAACSPETVAGGGEEADVTLRIGRIPQAQGMTPVTEVMREDELVEQAAKDLGVDVAVEWTDFPDGGTIRQAMTSDNLDFGSVGNTPTLIGIAQKEPLRILSMAEGGVKFLISLAPDSPIRNLSDLEGQTAGLLLGTDLQFFFDLALKNEFGTSNYEELGIQTVGIETLPQAATLPKGIDVSSVVEAPYLQAHEEGLNTALINSYGFTEEHYDGPAGQGAGHELPGLRQSPYYPEGLYLHRNFWLVTEQFAQDNPNAVTAFLIAEQRAMQKLADMEAEEVAALAEEYWGLDPAVGKDVWLHDLDYRRGWPWLTEGDLRAVVDQSELAATSGLIEAPVTWEQVIENIEPIAPLAKKAWEETGFPDEAEFTATNVDDLRGPPMWETDEWRSTEESQ